MHLEALLQTGEDRLQISLVDISRAYFNAGTDPDKPVYVELPREDPDWGEGLCGKLNVHMYGTRPAADGWYGMRILTQETQPPMQCSR